MGIITAIIVIVWGIGSLFFVAVKTKSVRTVFLKKPSIFAGDFLILPIISGLIVNSFGKRGIAIVDLSSAMFYLSIMVGLVLAAFSAIRNQQINFLWLPHVLFYWFMASLVFYFLVVSFDLKSAVWWLVLIGILIHQTLGVIYLKKFPEL